MKIVALTAAKTSKKGREWAVAEKVTAVFAALIVTRRITLSICSGARN
jgi:hypothetical protein